MRMRLAMPPAVIRRVASIPSIFGIWTSIRITSGRNLDATPIASSPSPASPTLGQRTARDHGHPHLAACSREHAHELEAGRRQLVPRWRGQRSKRDLPNGALLPVWAAALLLLGYAAAFSALGTRFVVRRDIT